MNPKNLTFLIFAFFLSTSLNATTYYVRVSGGSDSNNGLTPATAFQSLTKVFSGSPALANNDIIDISGTFDYVIGKAISKTITIQGNDKSTAVIRGSQSVINKCFTVNAGVTLTIENVTFRDYYNYDASVTKTAGVIYVNAGANLTCRFVDFINNQSYAGGAIDIAAAGSIVNFEDCYFNQNKAVNTTASLTSSGGAVNINHSTASTTSDITFNRCLFEGNSTNANGAAIYYKAIDSTSPKLLIQNCTFFGNTQNLTSANGGAVYMNIMATTTDDIKIVNSTIAYNTSQYTGTSPSSRPGLYFIGTDGKLVMINTLLAYNTDGNSASRSIVNGVKFKETRNCFTDMNFGFWSATLNNISSGCQYSLTTEQIGLGTTLTSKGGANKILPLNSTSFAVNGGYATGAPTIDQRGTSRTSVDVGAYEFISYRSKNSGNWNAASSWQQSANGSTWSDASLAASSTLPGTISVQPGHLITITTPATSPDFVVQGGGQVTLNSGSTLSVTGNMTINSDASNGTGSFVDKNNVSGLTITGTSTIQQYLNSSRNWYMASPMNNALLPSGYTFYKRNEAGANWTAVNSGNSVDPGIGFIVQNPSANVISFSGTINSGTVNIPVTGIGATKTGFNLVGNPYSSYMNWLESTATAGNVLPTIWYRTYSGGYIFQTYNAQGDMGSPLSANGIIPPMQAFWVKANSGGGTLTFNNSLRTHDNAQNNPLKTRSVKNQKPTLRLLISDDTYSDETVVYTADNAQNNIDSYDSPKMLNENGLIPEIYTKTNDEKLVINGLNSISENLELVIGYNYNKCGDLRLKAIELTNFENIQIFLLDKATETEIELAPETEYQFSTSVAVSNESRFSLIFRSESTTTYLKETKLNAEISVNDQSQISIIASSNCKYLIYNSIGQIITTGNVNSSTKLNPNLESGLYLIKLTDGKKEITKKFIIQ